MIVTIDGPAGAGKSSIARQVADRLGFEFLDTGALYRAVTLAAIRQQIEFDDVTGLVRVARESKLRWKDCRIYLDGEDVTDLIRTPTVTSAICHLADIADVRHQLSQQQRRIARGRDIVTEGRDQGSEVFPSADCKIFLTASSRERALRRQQQLAETGRHLSLDEVLDAQNRRDREDQSRPIGALRPAPDAVVLQTDGMSADEVLARTLEIIEGVIVATRTDAD